MIDYTVACSLCGDTYHRKEYKKHGGGVYKICKSCRAKVRTERWRMLTNVRALKKLEADRQRTKAVHKLTVEYNKVTGVNRYKIKSLLSREKPTRATLKSLAVRQTLQEQWDTAYKELLAIVEAGGQYQSLRDYMENRQCLDVQLLSQKMETLYTAPSNATAS